MARRFDVSARLAEGRDAVSHTQTYVSASRLRGYQHPDLTGYGSQVRDWYDGEDGLDLQLLGDDCARLEAGADLAEEAVRMQRAQLAELAAAWSGPGGDAAVGFVRGHCDSGAALAARLRAAAQACAALRDGLWRVIDDKVAAAVSIDDRTYLQRPLWLAAASATPAGDPGAAEVIDQQVTPYVDGEIGVEWLGAMRCARDRIGFAFDAAIAEVAPGPEAVFPTPGEFGLRRQAQPPAEALPSAASVPVTPAAATRPVADPATAEPDWVAPVTPAAPATPAASAPLPGDPWSAPPADAAGAPADFGWPTDAGGLGGLGEMPAGAAGLAGLGGLIPRLVGALSGLLGSSDDGLAGPDLDGLLDPLPDEALPADGDPGEPGEPDEPGEPGEPGEPDAAEVVAADTESEPSAAATAEGPTTPADRESGAPAEQTATVMPPEDSALAESPADKTPCEAAADELPQVGQ